MIYAEFIEHDRTLPIQIFEHLRPSAGMVSDIDVKLSDYRTARFVRGPFWQTASADTWKSAGEIEHAPPDPPGIQ